MNTRSVKNKQLQIVEIIKLENIDFTMLTETWLKNTDEDMAWVSTCNLNNNNLRLDTVNRNNKQGGGIALLHKKEYNTTKLETGLQLDTIEHGVWSTTIRNKKLTLAGIYHPPIGSSKSNTHTKFLDEVSKLTQLLITNYTNLVLLGHFNIHTQDTKNADSITYNNTMEALGLTRHIEKPTYRLGNTLDQIYTESLDRVRVVHSFIGNFISDHRVVGIELKTKKQLEKHQSTMHRNYRDFNLNNFSQVFNNNKILNQPSLDEAVQIFNEEMERTLDEIAPKEKKREQKRQNKQWFTSQLLEQRKIVRNQERAYLAYRENQHWKAFTRERNRYNKMLEYSKRHHLVTAINETSQDPKKLFKLLNNILGNNNENWLLKGTTDSRLAEKFTDFFLEKINKIREGFTNIPPYQPKERYTPKLKNLTTITQDQLGKTIKEMPTKSCQLDVIPTDKLKKILRGCLPALTHIINKSLETSHFCNKWKEALVKPLIKKPTAG